MGKKQPKCYLCKKPTPLKCGACGRPICADHAYTIKRNVYCYDCFKKVRRKGMILQWAFVLVIVIGAIIVLHFDL